jgi:DNA (cytosine-5)-methyltransferase 1
MRKMMRKMTKIIPVIDLFAGPGGLGEGFASFADKKGSTKFKIGLSIEKEVNAHTTLELRSFFRQFPFGKAPKEYYEFCENVNIPEKNRRDILFDKYPDEANLAVNEARCAELGKTDHKVISGWIKAALCGNDAWILIGGPPCQAYSIAGRSRNKGNIEYVPENDERQYLYIEYLRIISEFCPAVFVMENVKGLLSAKLKDKRIFDRICMDLENPAKALLREKRIGSIKNRNCSYELHAIASSSLMDGINLKDFIVKMEDYGIPQFRHRIIIVGVRNDLTGINVKSLIPSSKIPVSDVLNGLPKLRSGISKAEDSLENWKRHLKDAKNRRWYNSAATYTGLPARAIMKDVFKELKGYNYDRGKDYIDASSDISYRKDWYLDPRMKGICNHSSRSHMVKDLYRYLYASCFAKYHGKSPMLNDFPKDLLPNHKSVAMAMKGSNFADRFRVQVYNKPATTITSHISKDGHYYIHPDPSQCRSLSVREAARLQTFPDNYYFCGSRTSQYHQVGNAVPPLLAYQIAEIVYDILSKSGIAE